MEIERTNKKRIVQNFEKKQRADKLILAKINGKEQVVHHMRKPESMEPFISVSLALEFNNILSSVIGYNDMNQMFSDEITDEVLRRAIQNNIQEVNLASKQAVKKVNYMQKIENIHLLTTGGIAHEFNNILSCVLGYNEMSEFFSHDITDEVLRLAIQDNIQQVHLAGKRATELVSKMLTAEFEQAPEDFKHLLDNSAQGFLSFGANLIINDQYSRACETMLGESPAKKNASDVFFSDDKSKADLFRLIISSVLDETEESVRENMLSLLPTEMQHGELVLKTEYKMLEHNKFMVILTNITQERHIATMLEIERKNLQFVVMAVSDSRNFFDIIDGFRTFIAQLPQELTKELYREIHTYKGLLNQFCFPNTPPFLHEVENDLSELLTHNDALKAKHIAEIILPNTLKIPFEKDLAILTDALGSDFLMNDENIFLTGSLALQIEKLAMCLLRGEMIDTSTPEIRRLLKEMCTLRKVSLKSMLMSFDGLVQQAAKTIEKQVAPLLIIDDEHVTIDWRTYQPFIRSLVHVFRNAVVHGIESPEERLEIEKEENGTITCHISQENNVILLTIFDDGAGINLNALRERIAAVGIHTVDEIAAMSDDEVTQFIFVDNISTRRDVTELAGRGVGLAAVLNEVHNLGGEVRVKTAVGQGTQFLFRLPLILSKNLEKTEV